MSALRIAADRAKALEPHIIAKALGANGADDHFSSGHNGVAVERCGLGPRARGGGAGGGGGGVPQLSIVNRGEGPKEVECVWILIVVTRTARCTEKQQPNLSCWAETAVSPQNLTGILS